MNIPYLGAALPEGRRDDKGATVARGSRVSPSQAPAEPAPRLLRRGWPGVVQAVAIAAILAGAAVAIYAERSTMRTGITALAHVRPAWIAAGVAAEFVSMAAFGELQRCLLQAGGVSRDAFTLRSVLATAYGANAISVTVPVIGSGIATGYLYRDFRRHGAAPSQISIALTVAGVFSTAAFAALAAAGALATGNLAAGIAAGVSAAAGLVAVAFVLLALRVPRLRAVLERLIVAMLRLSRRMSGRPRSEPRQLLGDALARADRVRLGYRAGGYAFGCALANWAADAFCLICAIEAVGAPVPWRSILIIWTAGAGAASFSPIPAGLGVVDVVLIAALAGAGLPAPHAVAAVLLYRIITFKIVVTMAWLAYHHLAERRRHASSGDLALPREVCGAARGRAAVAPAWQQPDRDETDQPAKWFTRPAVRPC